MSAASFSAKVGSTSDVRASRSDFVVVHEPDTGALLRTKGRLFLLCEVAGLGSPTSGVAKCSSPNPILSPPKRGQQR